MCLQMVLEAVRPSSHAALGAQEYTLAVALLPLRVRLDQHCVTFLQQLLAGEETPAEPSRSGSRQDLQKEGSVGGLEQQGEAAAVATAGVDSGGRLLPWWHGPCPAAEKWDSAHRRARKGH